MSGTRPPVRYIRLGEDGVRESDLGPSENQATPKVAGSKRNGKQFCNTVQYFAVEKAQRGRTLLIMG